MPVLAIGIAAAIAGLGLAPRIANADGLERERGSVMLSAFDTNRRARARVDASNGSGGTDVDLQADLGLDSSTFVARFDGYFWVSRRHRLDLSYFDLSRSVDHKIDETIDWGDQTFPINTVVTTDNRLTIVKADYTFAVLSKARGFLGITGGLYLADTRFTLSNRALGESQTDSLTAPLPVIGARGDYAITHHFTLRGASEWFGITTNDVSGRLTDNYLGVDYGFGKRVFVGLAYDKVSTNIDANKTSSLRGRLDWSYGGWLLYFKADFGGGVSQR